jgi:hypothetical protein
VSTVTEAPSPKLKCVAESIPRIELLWWEGCPNTEEALALLREEVERLGLDPEAIRLREIASDSDAEREGFPGSPTIRVDGRDVLPPRDEPIGLTCRVYRLRDGRISPLPDRQDVRDTLITAIEGATDGTGDSDEGG